MKTPIADFVRCYQESGMVRFHMPGHKGAGLLGCESFDITEIAGADELYDARGIIAESERNAASLFGAGRTFYSTEGSSQCIRAMLRLAMLRQTGGTPLILAARNVHKAFVYGAALLGAGSTLAVAGEDKFPVFLPHFARSAGKRAGSASFAARRRVRHQPRLSGRHGGCAGPCGGLSPA